MMQKFHIILICVLILVCFKFFDAQFLNESLTNYLLYLSVIGTLMISVPYIIPRSKGFVLPVQLLVFSILISMLTASLYWDQSLKDSIIVTLPYLIIVFFFYLHRIEFPVKTLEKIIICFGVLYVGLYFFQLYNSPTVLFGKSLWGDEFTESRGITRIIFPGGGVFILTIFIALNKLTSEKHYRWLWIVLVIFGIAIPFLQVTRQFILGIAIIYAYHFMKYLSWNKKILMAIIGGLSVFYIFTLSNPLIEGLIESTESDTQLGTDYIRVVAGEFFLFDFSPNVITAILGNGVPYTGTSNYGLYLDYLNESHYFFLSDVGIIAVYVMFGFMAIVAFAMIWIRSFTIALPPEYQYLKYYLWFLLLTSLTWYTTYHYHYLIITTMVLYMFQSVHENRIVTNGTN